MNLHSGIDIDCFDKSYFLKEELLEFARQEGLQTTGNKQDLTKIVRAYLTTGEKIQIHKKQEQDADEDIILASVISLPIKFSEKKRAFFKQYLGENFHFSVPFQRWCKANAGKTYQDAVNAYPKIMEENKKGTTKIDKQFEYNTYIRAFFKENPGRNLKEAIRCWNYRKAQQGSHAYQDADLEALTTE